MLLKVTALQLDTSPVIAPVLKGLANILCLEIFFNILKASVAVLPNLKQTWCTYTALCALIFHKLPKISDGTKHTHTPFRRYQLSTTHTTTLKSTSSETPQTFTLYLPSWRALYQLKYHHLVASKENIWYTSYLTYSHVTVMARFPVKIQPGLWWGSHANKIWVTYVGTAKWQEPSRTTQQIPMLQSALKHHTLPL